MTYEEIEVRAPPPRRPRPLRQKSRTEMHGCSQQAYPEDFANRDEDKFNYRYRGAALLHMCSIDPHSKFTVQAASRIGT